MSIQDLKDKFSTLDDEVTIKLGDINVHCSLQTDLFDTWFEVMDFSSKKKDQKLICQVLNEHIVNEISPYQAEFYEGLESKMEKHMTKFGNKVEKFYCEIEDFYIKNVAKVKDFDEDYFGKWIAENIY